MRVISVLFIALTLSLVITERAHTQNTADVKSAINKSIPLLQSVGVPFIENTGCASCHHNVLPAMATATARKYGFKVNDGIAREQSKKMLSWIEAAREKMLQGVGIPGDATTVSYALLGLAADKYPADKNTDAMVHYLIGKQASDGRWQPVAYRPPIEYSDFTTTAITAHAIQLYAPKGRTNEIGKRVARAREWLVKATPVTSEERAYQLLGLVWSRANKQDVEKAAKSLLAQQRPDGGWSQIATLSSDAYATGQALFALAQGGILATNDPAYQRGVNYLLKTQLGDGSWFVQTRAIGFQRYFESGFPHGKSQFISAAGTSWATLALTLSVAP
jgi:hypothetical protein